MNINASFLAIVLSLLCSTSQHTVGSQLNVLPKEAVEALHSPETAILYSLEPLERPKAGDKTLHNFKVLGLTTLNSSKARIVCNAFKKAVKDWPGMTANCFDPRIALRVTAKGHTFDFLLCYQCNALDVYKDDKPMASFGAGGSPALLNGALSSAGIPLAKSDMGRN